MAHTPAQPDESESSRLRESFLKLLRPHQPSLRAYFMAATRDGHETEDLMQRISLAMYDRFDHYDADRPFINWAMGFARTEVLKWRRDRARNREMLSGQTLNLLAAEAENQPKMTARIFDLLEDCLSRLSAKTRQLIGLRYGQDLPIAEVAESIDKKIGATEMALVRARRALRRCLQDRLNVEAD
ncbi:MAG: sigma-70 family RNA polymerase sigma factor [Phycisphaeraceae bacterium]|nr:sigma-70 family RNA polymerase sigma factor [Phycisphaeraceae bacterium]